MWGPSIVGFGSYHYKYDSGDAPLLGFSPRTNAITFYINLNMETQTELLGSFGKHKTGKECIYVKKLDDIDIAVLKKMIIASVSYMTDKYSS